MHANYYEGVLQLRNPTEQAEQFIIHEFKRKKTVFITKEKRMKASSGGISRGVESLWDAAYEE